MYPPFYVGSNVRLVMPHVLIYRWDFFESLCVVLLLWHTFIYKFHDFLMGGGGNEMILLAWFYICIFLQVYNNFAYNFSWLCSNFDSFMMTLLYGLTSWCCLPSCWSWFKCEPWRFVPLPAYTRIRWLSLSTLVMTSDRLDISLKFF
jgi:hypothetical protein